MHLVLIMAATLSVASISGNRWELPCLSPQDLLAQDEETIGPDWGQSSEEIITVSTLSVRKPSTRHGVRGHRTSYQPASEDPEQASRNKLMHWFGLREVDSDRRLGLGFHFEKVRNFTLHVKLAGKKPAIGVGYYTRY